MTESVKPQHLSIRAILPGLMLICIVDGLTLLQLWPYSGPIHFVLSLILFALPWATLVVMRSPITTLGYRRRQVLRAFGWGMVAGGFWRIISILLNLWGTSFGLGAADFAASIIGAIVWVPLLEETFFRGYLGRALAHSVGLWPGITIQALLFTLHPVHVSQGWLSMISVFGFGILAGWIQNRFNSIWSAWGAHAFANVLPMLTYFI